MRNYSTARGLLSFIEFVAWSLVVAGVVVALLGLGVGNLGGASIGRPGAGALGGALGAIPGVFLAIFGLLFAALVQIARANVDTAEMTGKMLKVAEEHLLVAKRTSQIALSPPAVAGTVAPSFAPASKEKPDQIKAGANSMPAARSADLAASSSQPVEGLPATRPTASRASGPRYLETIEHAGWVIRRADDGKFYVGATSFDGLPPAKAFVEAKRDGTDVAS